MKTVQIGDAHLRSCTAQESWHLKSDTRPHTHAHDAEQTVSDSFADKLSASPPAPAVASSDARTALPDGYALAFGVNAASRQAGSLFLPSYSSLEDGLARVWSGAVAYSLALEFGGLRWRNRDFPVIGAVSP